MLQKLIGERQFFLFSKAHKTLKISFSLVCSGKEVSRSCLAVMSSKTILMTIQYTIVSHMNRLVKVEGKGTHTRL